MQIKKLTKLNKRYISLTARICCQPIPYKYSMYLKIFWKGQREREKAPEEAIFYPFIFQRNTTDEE
jgi:hypothetical protein